MRHIFTFGARGVLLPRPHSEAIAIFGMLYDCKGFWDRANACSARLSLPAKLYGGHKLIN